MQDAPLFLWSLLMMLPLPLLTWIVSLFKRDVSIVDSTWALMFLALTLVYASPAWQDGALQPRAALVLLLVAVWALRLSLYITWRNRGKPEDHRYRTIRRRHEPGFAFKSLYLIFGLQALLAWFISLPLFAAATGSAPLGLLDLIAVLVWLTGFGYEAVADAQLAAFRADPANRGRVLDSGLWRYTRHPNYFGECILWWGYYLLAVAAGGWWTLPAPLLMTFLLLRVSGVALLERDIVERRPAYREYVQHTNAFVPGPRRLSLQAGGTPGGGT